MRFTNVFGGIF